MAGLPRDDVDRELAALGLRLLDFRPQHEHDHLVLLAIEQAFVAADHGNPAVGAVLFDATGAVIQRGPARNLKPYFRSDLHAEMQLITLFEERNRFENQAAVEQVMQGSTLMSSLEPCTMCMARLIMSGVTNVFYAADELGGGMVHLSDNLPDVWKELIESNGKCFARADCTEELREIAFQAFLTTISASGRTDLGRTPVPEPPKQ